MAEGMADAEISGGTAVEPLVSVGKAVELLVPLSAGA